MAERSSKRKAVVKAVSVEEELEALRQTAPEGSLAIVDVRQAGEYSEG